MRLVKSRPWLVLLVAASVFYAVYIARDAMPASDDNTYFVLFDDAMISMRYARNFAEGNGLVWNPGEAPVEGYTNFLWTIWMAALHKLPLDESKASLPVMMSGAVLMLINVFAVGALCRRLRMDLRPSIFAGVMTAFHYPLIHWSLQGMEVSLMTLLITSQAFLAIRYAEERIPRDVVLLAALFVIAVLTRMEAVIPVAIICVYLFMILTGKNRIVVPVLLTVIPAAALGLHTLFRLSYYGMQLPNTYYLKMTGASIAERIARGGWMLVRSTIYHLWPFLLSALIIVPSILKKPLKHAPLVLLVLLFSAQCAYSVYVGGDAWEYEFLVNRYINIVMPLLFILSAQGLWIAISKIQQSLPLQRVFYATLVSHANFAGMMLLIVTTPGGFDRMSIIAGALISTLVLGVLALLIPSAYPLKTGRPEFIRLYACAAVAIWAATSMPGFAHWVANGGVQHDERLEQVEYALFIREVSTPDATIAVTWAGSVPYFAHRQAIDLLGKNDPVIARAEPFREFYPGHDKWDYDYSVGESHPDIIVDVPEETEEIYARLRRDGYALLPNEFYVLEQSEAVSWDAIDEYFNGRKNLGIDTGFSLDLTWLSKSH